MHDSESNDILGNTINALDLGIIFGKAERDAVYAVTLVGRSFEALAFEDMAKMTAAAITGNFNALHSPASVGVAVDSTRDGVKESRPAAAGVKLGSGFVQWTVAASTCVHAVLGVVLVELACTGSLGALLSQDPELFWVELGAPL